MISRTVLSKPAGIRPPLLHLHTPRCRQALASTWITSRSASSTTRTQVPPHARPIIQQKTPKAWGSTLNSEEKSGHISADRNETLLFFDSMFPLFTTCPESDQLTCFCVKTFSPLNSLSSSEGHGRPTRTLLISFGGSTVPASGSWTPSTWSRGPFLRTSP